MLRKILNTALVLGLSLGVSSAWSGEPLDRDALKELVYGKTANCLKEKDQSICNTFFAEDGRVAQIRPAQNKRKDGRWFLDDADRLCILWDGKIKPLCFTVSEDENGHFPMVKNGKNLSTITDIAEGNPFGL